VSSAGREWAFAAFFGVIVLAFALAWRAARRGSSSETFFVAGRRVGAKMNALALLGEMSAASIMGTAALAFSYGFDALYSVLGLVGGWALVLILLAERLRAKGNRTLGDVLSAHFDGSGVRLLLAVSALGVAIPHTFSQFVAAGVLVNGLFGLSYGSGVIVFGVLTAACVILGGMLGTTWIQTIKAVLLIACLAVILALTLASYHFDLATIFASAAAVHPAGQAVLRPGLLMHGTLDAVSYVLTMGLGVAGLPHILSRFFTVPDPRQARQSAALALSGVVLINWAVVLMGFAAIGLIAGRPGYALQGIRLVGGENMAFLHLAHYLAGDVFFGLLCGVVLMTVLAAVSAVVLSAATTLVVDFYRAVVPPAAGKANDVLLSRIAIAFVCLIAGIFALLSRHSNIGLLATIAHAFAASVNFPLIVLTLYWPGLTRRGVLLGGAVGFITALGALILGPLVWCDMLGFAAPIFPNHYPTLVSVPAAFLAAWLGSVRAGVRARDARSLGI
jgi:cation/acetate symporter